MICDTVTGHISFVFKLLPSKSEDSSFSFPLNTENKMPLVSNLVLQGPGKGEVACAAVSVSLEAGSFFGRTLLHLSWSAMSHIAAGV